MGKNLWSLLFSSTDDGSSSTIIVNNINGPKLGQLSHGTLHSFLGSRNAAEYMRTWRLKDAFKVIERVRAMLLAERTGADWEVVMDEEISRNIEDKVEGGGEQKGGVVNQGLGEEDLRRLEGGGVGEDAALLGGGSSAKRRESARAEPFSEGKARGPSGWMKIRGRSGA